MTTNKSRTKKTRGKRLIRDVRLKQSPETR